MTPHSLRHTWDSLHLARNTPIEWVRAMGGWSSAKMLLDVYGHYMPREMRGFSDSLAPSDRTKGFGHCEPVQSTLLEVTEN